MTFGQPVGETFALIEVPGVKGARLEGASGRTDGAGYTLEGYVQPYRYNNLSLDTQTLGTDVDVNETSTRVVPRRGAVVKAHFAASSGRRVQFNLLQSTGANLPFGAQLFEGEKLLAVVDNQSRALVFGIPDKGQLQARWAGGSCHIPYTLPERDASLVYDQVNAACSAQPLTES